MRFFNRCLVLVAFFLVSGLVSSAQAQLFKNNNQVCQRIQVAGELVNGNDFNNEPLNTQSLACGRFNDDTALGNPDFPDCASQRDPLPATDVNPFPISNNVLINTGARNNNCIEAGEPNAQFKPALALNNKGTHPMLNVGEVSPIRMGTIRTGNLDNQNFDDLVFSFVFDKHQPDNTPSELQWLFSLNGGGFGVADFIPNQVDFNPLDIPFPLDVFGDFLPPYPGLPTDRTLAVMDCNGDGFDDAISVSKIDADTSRLVVFQNNGNGSLAFKGGSTLDFLFSQFVSIALAPGDFNQDGILDIAAVVNSDLDLLNFESEDAATLCFGNGMCGFTCGESLTTQIANLKPICVNDGGTGCDNPFPMSMVSGDFNGDTLLDLAITEAGASDVLYLLNDGVGDQQIANWPTRRVAIPAMVNMQNTTPRPLIITAGQFTPEAIASDTQEVALSVPRYLPNAPLDFGEPELDSTVVVITTDGNGNLNAPLTLGLGSPATSASSIEVKNFDHCGGDDLMVLVSDSDKRDASVFINDNETPITQVPPDLQADPNQILPIAASCVDPTRDDRAFIWLVATTPPGAQVNLGTVQGALVFPQQDASTTFQADLPGDYVIQLGCVDFCGALDIKQVNITIKGAATGTGGDTTTGTDATTGTSTGSETNGVDTGLASTGSTGSNAVDGGSSTTGTSVSAQGGCIASINPGMAEQENFGYWALILLLPMLRIVRRTF